MALLFLSRGELVTTLLITVMLPFLLQLLTKHSKCARSRGNVIMPEV